MFLRHGNQAAAHVWWRNDEFGFLADFRYEYNSCSPNNAWLIVSSVDLADAKQEGAQRKDVFQLGPRPRVQSAILGDLPSWLSHKLAPFHRVKEKLLCGVGSRVAAVVAVRPNDSA